MFSLLREIACNVSSKHFVVVTVDRFKSGRKAYTTEGEQPHSRVENLPNTIPMQGECPSLWVVPPWERNQKSTSQPPL